MTEPLSRRTVLRGGVGVVGLGLAGTFLAACGKKAGGTLDLGIVSPTVGAGHPQRLVFVVRDKDNEFIAPTEAKVRLGNEDKASGAPLPIVVHTDANGAPAYVTVTATLAAGTSWLHLESKEGKAAGPVEAVDAPRGVQAGMGMPAVPTPTTADALGIEALCTRIPPCPLHERTLGQALELRRPLAVLVATPAYCQTAVCGPVLSVLLDALPSMNPDLVAVHLEVYAKKPAGADISQTPLSPAVAALGLESEPVLFLVDSRGLVAQRLDGIVGTAELKAAVATLA